MYDITHSMLKYYYHVYTLTGTPILTFFFREINNFFLFFSGVRFYFECWPKDWFKKFGLHFCHYLVEKFVKTNNTEIG